MMTEENVLGLPTDQIEDRRHELISSRRVEGTPVFSEQGEKLGDVRSVMLNKRSGQAAYALMSFGGFLGMGQLVHPIPWSMLDYDEDQDGYIVNLTREQLEKAPTFRPDEADRPRQRDQEELIYSYYGQVPFWGPFP